MAAGVLMRLRESGMELLREGVVLWAEAGEGGSRARQISVIGRNTAPGVVWRRWVKNHMRFWLARRPDPLCR